MSSLEVKERKSLIKYTFGLIILPLITDRKLTITMIERLSTLINFYGIEQPIDNISHAYDYKHNIWYKREFAIEYIKMTKFFLMFTPTEFSSLVFPKIILKKYEKNDVIFTMK